MSLRLIRELHAHLMEGVRGGQSTPGEFRRSQNWIGKPGGVLNDATFIPPPVDEMHECLDAFEKYLHVENDYPPLVRLALIHYQFEAIHPFLDGNGRIGRLLMSLLLVSWGLLPAPLLYLSVFLELHREDYYDLLLSVNERGAWAGWIEFFLHGVTEQAHDAISRAKRLQDLWLEWRARLMEARGSALTSRLVDSLFEWPIVTIPQSQRLLGVTYRGAQLVVERLSDLGILRQIGREARVRLFMAEEVMRILADD